ncbi:MAG: MopE-related protein, partial [Bacteroidota bacterium]
RIPIFLLRTSGVGQTTDNDCNGTVDDDPEPVLCDNQVGACAGAVASCVSGLTNTACSEQEYRDAATAAGVEYEGVGLLEVLCDGIDNNCDGRVDENCCDNGNLILVSENDSTSEGKLTSIEIDGHDLIIASSNIRNQEQYYLNDFFPSDIEIDKLRFLSPMPSVEHMFNYEESLLSFNIAHKLFWSGSSFKLARCVLSQDEDLTSTRTVGSFLIDRIEQNFNSSEYFLDVLGRPGPILGVNRLIKGIDVKPFNVGSDRFVSAWSNGYFFAPFSGANPHCEHANPAARCIQLALFDSNMGGLGDVTEFTQTIFYPGVSVPRATNPRIAMADTDHSGVVVWQDDLHSEHAELCWRVFDEELNPISSKVCASELLVSRRVSTSRLSALIPDRDYDVIALFNGYLIAYIAMSSVGDRGYLKIIHLDVDGHIISEHSLNGDMDVSAQYHPILARLSENELAMVWWSNHRLMYVLLNNEGHLLSNLTTLAEGVTFWGPDSFAIVPLPDPDWPGRNLGLVFTALLERSLFVGFVNPSGQKMCFSIWDEE